MNKLCILIIVTITLSMESIKHFAILSPSRSVCEEWVEHSNEMRCFVGCIQVDRGRWTPHGSGCSECRALSEHATRGDSQSRGQPLNRTTLMN